MSPAFLCQVRNIPCPNPTKRVRDQPPRIMNTLLFTITMTPAKQTPVRRTKPQTRIKPTIPMIIMCQWICRATAPPEYSRPSTPIPHRETWMLVASQQMKTGDSNRQGPIPKSARVVDGSGKIGCCRTLTMAGFRKVVLNLKILRITVWGLVF